MSLCDIQLFDNRLEDLPLDLGIRSSYGAVISQFLWTRNSGPVLFFSSHDAWSDRTAGRSQTQNESHTARLYWNAFPIKLVPPGGGILSVTDKCLDLEAFYWERKHRLPALLEALGSFADVSIRQRFHAATPRYSHAGRVPHLQNFTASELGRDGRSLITWWWKGSGRQCLRHTRYDTKSLANVV